MRQAIAPLHEAVQQLLPLVDKDSQAFSDYLVRERRERGKGEKEGREGGKGERVGREGWEIEGGREEEQ